MCHDSGIREVDAEHLHAPYDISDLANVREVSRVTFDDKQKPHWIAADADTVNTACSW